MQLDRYENTLSTDIASAAAAYIEGVDLYLAANVGAEAAFEAALEIDPAFALAYIGLARVHHVFARRDEMRACLDAASALKTTVSPRETFHIDHMTAVMSGRGAETFQAGLDFLEAHPRDVLVAQSYLGVFSLIGFSGRNDREALNLMISSRLAPFYGEDWWFLSQHAFSLSETGDLTQAERLIDRALALNPNNANGVHHRAHLLYEAGRGDDGSDFLQDWMPSYDPHSLMHNHLSWHLALWALETHKIDEMWMIVDQFLDLDTTSGPPINVMTDMVSLLFRAELEGVKVPSLRWQQVSAYASRFFSKPRLPFADAHSAIAYVMAGNTEGFQMIVEHSSGPTATLVRTAANGFSAMAQQDWGVASRLLGEIVGDHAALGGSRAQRDLIELAWIATMARQDKREEAIAVYQERWANRPINWSG